MSTFAAPYAPSERLFPVALGPYRVVRLVASGTTSDVFVARQQGPRGFERFVALKVLLPDLRDDPRASRAFVREATAYARVLHPAVLRLYDFVDWDGDLALVLEHVEGLALNKLRAELHRVGDPLSDGAAMFVAGRVFSALAAAHAARDPVTGEFTPVVHGDVSPSNVLVPWDGFVKLGDFGSARLPGEPYDGAWPDGARPYMAPEQARGQAPSMRSDVYSGCLVLWELLSGRRAIAPGRRSKRAVLDDIAHPRLPPLASLRPDLPHALLDVVARGLQVDPDRRHVHAEEVAGVLRALRDVGAGRTELAGAVSALRLAYLGTEPLETTPNLPDSGPELPPFRRMQPSIPEPVWAARREAGSPPPADVPSSPAPYATLWSDRPVTVATRDAEPDDGRAPGWLATLEQTLREAAERVAAHWPKTPKATAGWVLTATALAGTCFAAGLLTTRGTGRGAALSTSTSEASRRAAPASSRALPTGLDRTVPPSPAASATSPPPRSDVPLAAVADPKPRPPEPRPKAPPEATIPTADVPASTAAAGERGIVRVPPAVAGHRVWIDRRLVGESPGAYSVECGAHLVRVGSHGAVQSIQVPCGGEIVVR